MPKECHAVAPPPPFPAINPAPPRWKYRAANDPETATPAPAHQAARTGAGCAVACWRQRPVLTTAPTMSPEMTVPAVHRPWRGSTRAAPSPRPNPPRETKPAGRRGAAIRPRPAFRATVPGLRGHAPSDVSNILAKTVQARPMPADRLAARHPFAALCGCHQPISRNSFCRLCAQNDGSCSTATNRSAARPTPNPVWRG